MKAYRRRPGPTLTGSGDDGEEEAPLLLMVSARAYVVAVLLSQSYNGDTPDQKPVSAGVT